MVDPLPGLQNPRKPLCRRRASARHIVTPTWFLAKPLPARRDRHPSAEDAAVPCPRGEGTYASPAASPRPSQGSLPAGVAIPFAGGASHPLDDKPNFMGSSHLSLLSDQPFLVALFSLSTQVAGSASSRACDTGAYDPILGLWTPPMPCFGPRSHQRVPDEPERPADGEVDRNRGADRRTSPPRLSLSKK